METRTWLVSLPEDDPLAKTLWANRDNTDGTDNTLLGVQREGGRVRAVLESLTPMAGKRRMRMKNGDTGAKELAVLLAMADTDMALEQLAETTQRLTLEVRQLQQLVAAAKVAAAGLRKEVEGEDNE